MAGADAYTRFLEGTGVVLGYPPALLPLIALGILLGLWRADGMVQGWPYYFGGLIVGIGVAAVSPPWAALSPMGIGIVAAVLTALMITRLSKMVIVVLSATMGIATTAAGLEGHGFLEISLMIHFGILLAASALIPISASVVRMSLDRFTQPWLVIGWRIAASWLAAIMLLYMAFAARGYLV